MKIWTVIKKFYESVAVINNEKKQLDDYGTWERYHRNNEERRKQRIRESHR